MLMNFGYGTDVSCVYSTCCYSLPQLYCLYSFSSVLQGESCPQSHSTLVHFASSKPKWMQSADVTVFANRLGATRVTVHSERGAMGNNNVTHVGLQTLPKGTLHPGRSYDPESLATNHHPPSSQAAVISSPWMGLEPYKNMGQQSCHFLCDSDVTL